MHRFTSLLSGGNGMKGNQKFDDKVYEDHCSGGAK